MKDEEYCTRCDSRKEADAPCEACRENDLVDAYLQEQEDREAFRRMDDEDRY